VSDERKRIAAIAMYAATGVDLDAATAGTPDADAAFRVADALLACGYELRDEGMWLPRDTFSKVTRVAVIGTDGLAFERYGIYEGGAELHIQDEGRTLKVFPASSGSE
jgi:hypothetical protein